MRKIVVCRMKIYTSYKEQFRVMSLRERQAILKSQIKYPKHDIIFRYRKMNKTFTHKKWFSQIPSYMS